LGTRGIVGVVVDGDVKVAYNHWDAYPDGVGNTTLLAVRRWLNEDRLGESRAKATTLVAVDEDATPTPEEWEKFKHLADTGVSKGDDWYALLRKTQGDIDAILDAGAYGDAIGFTGDSLFCEWGYVVDFDNEVFEVYKGFQSENVERAGRFADREIDQSHRSSGYGPIKLVRSFKFNELPENFDNLERDIAIENGDDPEDWE
jgi:hypothetical protein